MPTNLSNYFQDANSFNLKNYSTELLTSSPVDFSAITDMAHKLTLLDAELKGANYKQRNFMAENMFGNFVGLLYDHYPELMEVDSEKRSYVRLASNLRVYPKKLNDKYLPSNVVTRHVTKLNSQEMFEDDTKIHILYAGHMLTDESWPNQLKGTYISCVNIYYPSKLEWVLDAEDFRKGNIIQLPIHTQFIEERLVTAKLHLPQTGTDGAGL